MSITQEFMVSGVEWERVFLKIEITGYGTEETAFFLERFGEVKKTGNGVIRSVKSLERIQIIPERVRENKYSFCLNLAAVKGREFLENGKWRILAVVGGKETVCYVSYGVAYQFETLSRIFPYGKGIYAYNVYFSSETEEESGIWFVINSSFMKVNRKWRNRRYVEEVGTVAKKCKRCCMTVAIKLMQIFYYFWSHLFPKKGTRILLMSETREQLWGNLKAIDERMKERELNQEFQIDYSFRKSVGNRNSVFSWVKLIFKIAKQDYIFVDDYVPVFGFLNLDKRTKLIQVWHAGEGFKAVGYCRFGKDGSPFPTESCHKKYDYALAGSEKLVKVFSEVFGIEKEAFLPVGMPRLDEFLDEEKIAAFKRKFYEAYPNWKDKKIILFAPTYRGTGQETAYYDYSWLNLKEIYEFCGTEYVFLVKMHPFVHKVIQIPVEYQERVIDFTDYPNINELYYITELLITDYSSNYFEYSLMKKPMLFFTPDRELYEISRGVHRGVKESAPGKVCDTFDEMMTALKRQDFDYEKVEQFVKDNFSNYCGNATDQALEQILGITGK